MMVKRNGRGGIPVRRRSGGSRMPSIGSKRLLVGLVGLNRNEPVPILASHKERSPWVFLHGLHLSQALDNVTSTINTSHADAFTKWRVGFPSNIFYYLEKDNSIK